MPVLCPLRSAPEGLVRTPSAGHVRSSSAACAGGITGSKTHDPGWRFDMTADGVFTVTSPAGISRTTWPPGHATGRRPPTNLLSRTHFPARAVAVPMSQNSSHRLPSNH
jgi:hypothetical protein